jgi:histidyl-tRNA synthetase
MNAIGFGVNVSAIAKLISKKANITPPITTDILVYTEPDAFAKGMNYCKQLTAQGYKVEFGVQESLQTTKSYAQEKGISQIHIVTKDGTVTVQNIGEVNE